VTGEANKPATTAGPFADIPANNKYAAILTYLKNNKIFGGYADNTFKPTNTINRAELMKIVVNAKHFSEDISMNKNCFGDVHQEWFAQHVCYAKKLKWVTGYHDGNFKPSSQVTRAEAIKIILVSQNLKPASTAGTPWFKPYVQLAVSKNLAQDWLKGTESDSYFTQPITRLDVAILLYDVLNLPKS
jgi:hypothetical protein